MYGTVDGGNLPGVPNRVRREVGNKGMKGTEGVREVDGIVAGSGKSG